MLQLREALRPGGRVVFLPTLLLLLTAGLVHATETADVDLSATPAGQVLAAWLQAFNGGQAADMEAFSARYMPQLEAQRQLQLRARTGGLDVLRIERSSASEVVFKTKVRAGNSEEFGRIRLSALDPPRVGELRVFPAPPGSHFDDAPVSPAERALLIRRLTQQLKRDYVFPRVARRMALKLATRRASYGALTDGERLAAALTDDLRGVSHDLHLDVRYSPVIAPQREQARTATGPAAQVAAGNCGFEKVESRPAGIGYLNLDTFADPQVCADAAMRAMSSLAGERALIIDLRHNHGGRADMVSLIATYLFASPTHLNDIDERGARQELWTWKEVPGQRFIDKPVFLLISRETFSAAEDFSYALKNLARATLIGEPTGGGAHLVRPEPLDAHFLLVVPFARSTSPVTHTDWEGVGVQPDVSVAAAQALDEALRRAGAGAGALQPPTG